MTLYRTALHRFLAASLILVGVAFAQDPRGQKQQGGMMQHGSMMGMMQECRTHCRQMSGMHGDLQKTVEEARQSNDPVKMRAALEQVQKSLTSMEQHMSQCMRSMDSMEKMHGNMGGKQSESKKSDTKP